MFMLFDPRFRGLLWFPFNGSVFKDAYDGGAAIPQQVRPGRPYWQSRFRRAVGEALGSPSGLPPTGAAPYIAYGPA